jgi:hypothetical protein
VNRKEQTPDVKGRENMFNKGMGLVGVSIVICMAILTGMPVQAAQPVQGSHPGFGPGNASEPAMLAHAENLTSTLATKGVDISSMDAAIADAQNAIQNSNSTAFKDAMKSFGKALLEGLKNSSIPKSDIQQGIHAGFPGNRPGLRENGTFPLTPAMETKELGFARNLTSTLSSRGVDVSSLNAALDDAQSAIQNSNSTAFNDAMKSFTRDVRAEIKSGAISQSDLPQFSDGPMMGNRPDGSSKNHVRGTNTTQSA